MILTAAHGAPRRTMLLAAFAAVFLLAAMQPRAMAQSQSYPNGTILFYDGHNCGFSTAWSDFSWPSESVYGRFVVAPMGRQSVGRTATVGSVSGAGHSHGQLGGPIYTGSTGYVASPLGSNDSLAAYPTETTSSGSTESWGGLPSISRRPCITDGSGPKYPIPSGLIIFTDEGGCPSGGWTELTVAAGRLIVTLPDGGTNLATFGAVPNPDNTQMVTHDHSVNPVVALTSVGVTVAANNDKKDYVGVFPYAVTNAVTNSAAVNAPYVRLRLCQKD